MGPYSTNEDSDIIGSSSEIIKGMSMRLYLPPTISFVQASCAVLSHYWITMPIRYGIAIVDIDDSEGEIFLVGSKGHNSKACMRQKVNLRLSRIDCRRNYLN